MPLIVVCGQPCSGKSAVTAQLADLLRAKGLEVVVVDEDSLLLDRNESYRGGRLAGAVRPAARVSTCPMSWTAAKHGPHARRRP